MGSKEEIERLKPIIRSILLALGRTCNEREFRREFYEVEGDRFSNVMWQLKEKDFVQFLSKMPDVCRVYAYGDEVLISRVSTETSSHMDELTIVKNRNRKRARGRPSFRPRMQLGGFRAPMSMSRHRIPNLYSPLKYSPPPPPPRSVQLSSPYRGFIPTQAISPRPALKPTLVNIPAPRPIKPSLPAKIGASRFPKPNPSSYTKPAHLQYETVVRSSREDPVEPEVARKPEVPEKPEIHEKQEEAMEESEVKEADQEKHEKTDSSDGSSWGSDCEAQPDPWKINFSVKTPPKVSLSQGFRKIAPSGSNPLLKNFLEKVKLAARSPQKENQVPSAPSSTVSSVSIEGFEEYLTRKFSIPQARVRPVRYQLAFEIEVIYVNSPSQFVFQFSKSKFEEMTNDMNIHYNEECEKIHLERLVSGMSVAALEAGNWRRAEVLCLVGNSVFLFFVDINVRKYVDVKFIRHLKKDFAEVTRKSCRGSLFGVQPKAENHWDIEATMAFMSDVMKKKVSAILKGVSPLGAFELVLIDKTTKVKLADNLLQGGFAEIKTECHEPVTGLLA